MGRLEIGPTLRRPWVMNAERLYFSFLRAIEKKPVPFNLILICSIQTHFNVMLLNGKDKPMILVVAQGASPIIGVWEPLCSATETPL